MHEGIKFDHPIVSILHLNLPVVVGYVAVVPVVPGVVVPTVPEVDETLLPDDTDEPVVGA